ncbi:exosortase F system-associated protein [Mangrovimonas sp. AS39]|uniref:exosortase F system-associated membrane protein n=1 Tax=Mangrovimonas futianensis TaxID=2895523 RepID=UPI001E3B63F0|nr:exosortase F system-associated protein [Mangrovimonas futianensis]MCF1192456.1 exosortase F system-associated protein [Mangrovimonas futianensis]MCF1196214.1 exosortase F system-associated protein [Mangrovimonas futianensis]MCF1422577.1 exosortase F system-associated protein [Mangrovimonas futianensis]
MTRFLQLFSVFVLVILLVLIRYFEDQLFYDPYLIFFKNDYLYIDSPRRETLRLVLSTTLRFTLNTIISLGIIWVLFKDWGAVKFSAVLYGVAYVLLMMLFLYFVVNPRQEDYYLFFNVRRFLIQPIILLILIPAFYYQRLQVKV